MERSKAEYEQDTFDNSYWGGVRFFGFCFYNTVTWNLTLIGEVLRPQGDQGTTVFVKIYYSLEARHQFVADLAAPTFRCCIISHPVSMTSKFFCCLCLLARRNFEVGSVSRLYVE